METAITFSCQDLTLEGRLATESPAKCAVIAHPHPLYGGNMDNPVVRTVAEAYRSTGWSTLRFNFRGTGASQGRHDNGQGEQKDVEAALAYLSSIGFECIDLTGYSFGAWVLAQWAHRHPKHPHGIRMVAPPVAFMDFSNIRNIPGLRQVMVGSLDDIAPSRKIHAMMHTWEAQAELDIIQQADHFFGGYMEELHRVVEQRLTDP